MGIEKRNIIIWTYFVFNRKFQEKFYVFQCVEILRKLLFICVVTEDIFQQESSDIMRSLVTGLVMLVDLLKSHDTKVLAAACAVIGILAKEPENLAILTDYDIVLRLSSLVHTVSMFGINGIQNFYYAGLLYLVEEVITQGRIMSIGTPGIFLIWHLFLNMHTLMYLSKLNPIKRRIKEKAMSFFWCSG